MAHLKGKEPGILMERLEPEAVGDDGEFGGSNTDEEGRPLSPEERAEKKAYRLDGGNLCIPAANMAQCLREGGTEYKLGKALMQNVFILRDVDLGTDTYEVGSHIARQKGRNRAPYRTYRPWLREWEGDLVMEYDEAYIKRDDLKKCLATAGSKKGVMGWRPSSPSGKGGSFGRFTVVSFEEAEDGE